MSAPIACPKTKSQIPERPGIWLLDLRTGRILSRLKLSQHFEQFFVVRLIPNVVNVDVSQFSFLVHNENGALGNSVRRSVSTVRFGHFAFGMEIAEKIVGKSAETLGPGGIARHAVN